MKPIKCREQEFRICSSIMHLRNRVQFIVRYAMYVFVIVSIILCVLSGNHETQDGSNAALVINSLDLEAPPLRSRNSRHTVSEQGNIHQESHKMVRIKRSGGGNEEQLIVVKKSEAAHCLNLPLELQKQWTADPGSLSEKEVSLLLSPLTPDLTPLQIMEDIVTEYGRGSEAAWRLVQEIRKNRVQLACANHRQSAHAFKYRRVNENLKQKGSSASSNGKIEDQGNKYHHYYNTTNLIREYDGDEKDLSFNSIKDEVVKLRGMENRTTHLPVAELVMKRTMQLEHFLVDDVNKYIYCYVPKVACSQWKRVMMITSLKTTKPLEDIPGFEAHFQHGLPLLSDMDYSDSEVLLRLATYSKVLVVRDPLERLMSAYQDKLHSHAPDSAYFKTLYARPMMQAARGVDVEDGEGLLFEEMLQYLTSGIEAPEHFQEHWRPVYHLCHPCSIQYDFIAKFSRLEEDSNRILRYLLRGGQVGPQFPPVLESRTPALLQRHLRSLDPELVAAINRIYSLDFEMFGY